MNNRTCLHCAKFNDDPASIEAEIPGLTSFGSAFSSARGHAGICREFDRFMDPIPARRCPAFRDREKPEAQTMNAADRNRSPFDRASERTR